MSNHTSRIVADMAMSVDGYISDADGSSEALFGFYFGGDVEVETATPGMPFKAPAPSAQVLRDGMSSVGALVYGRRSSDLAKAWGGRHPMGVPVFVVTHRPQPAEGDVTFVTEGVERAVELAVEAAAGRTVGIASPSITRQCLDLGLLDAIHVNLVPVLLGGGTPWFAELETWPVRLEDPEIVASSGVTHLAYRVAR